MTEARFVRDDTNVAGVHPSALPTCSQEPSVVAHERPLSQHTMWRSQVRAKSRGQRGRSVKRSVSTAWMARGAEQFIGMHRVVVAGGESASERAMEPPDSSLQPVIL